MPASSGHDLTATLFHRPPPAAPPSSAHFDIPTLSTAFISTISSISSTSSASIPHTHRILDAPTSPHVLAITFTSPVPLDNLLHHPSLTTFEQQHSLELVLLPTLTTTTPKRLAVFDMDSTLIRQEVIDLLAAHCGVEAQVSSITARAMNGELDFSASLRERVRLLKGLDANVFEALKEKITVTPGAEVLIRVLKKRGARCALLSGGFTPLARWVAERLGIEFVHANFLEVREGVLTGELEEGSVIVDGAYKKQRLLEIAEEIGVQSEEEILAVGDGANDLPMLGAAGLGVAVNAKPRVQEMAPARLNGEMALLDVLFLMGLTQDEIDELAGP